MGFLQGLAHIRHKEAVVATVWGLCNPGVCRSLAPGLLPDKRGQDHKKGAGEARPQAGAHMGRF